MRFLLLNQFYPPDMAPTGRYLHDLARTLLERGHQVDVICSRRPYESGPALPREETLDGVEVHRLGGPRFGASLPGRLLAYAAFLLAALLAALFRVPRPDAIVALTTPPYVGWVALLAARRHRALHAHWVMDVYPEALVADGLLAAESGALRLLRALARPPLRDAAAVVALGPCMRAILERSHPGGRFLERPLWSPREPPGAPPPAPPGARPALGWSERELVLLYSGNLGRGHRVGEFLEAARSLGPGGPRWAFAGGGPRRAEVERFAAAHPAARVECLPYVAREQLEARLLAADVHLISLSRAFQGLLVPSKLQAAFALGRPVLFVGPDDNEVALWIRESGGGWVVGEDDVAGLLAAVAAAGEPGERARRGERALQLARERFDPRLARARLALCLEAAGA